MLYFSDATGMPEDPLRIENLAKENFALVNEVADIKDKLLLSAIAFRIQSYYAKQGICRDISTVMKVVVTAYEISQYFVMELPIDGDKRPMFLIAFAMTETDINPFYPCGKAGDTGICQILHKDYKTLKKQLRDKKIQFKDDLMDVRTNMLCCAMQWANKYHKADGNIRKSIMWYNGSAKNSSEYPKRFYRMLRVVQG